MKRLTATLLFLVVIGAFAAPAMASGGNPGLPGGHTFVLAASPKFNAVIVVDPNPGSPAWGMASLWLAGTAGIQVRADFNLPLGAGCDSVDPLTQANDRFLNRPLENYIDHFALVKLFSTLGVSIANEDTLPLSAPPFVVPIISQVVSAKCVPVPLSVGVGATAGYSVVEAVIQLAVPPKK